MEYVNFFKVNKIDDYFSFILFLLKFIGCNQHKKTFKLYDVLFVYSILIKITLSYLFYMHVTNLFISIPYYEQFFKPSSSAIFIWNFIITFSIVMHFICSRIKLQIILENLFSFNLYCNRESLYSLYRKFIFNCEPLFMPLSDFI